MLGGMAPGDVRCFLLALLKSRRGQLYVQAVKCILLLRVYG